MVSQIPTQEKNYLCTHKRRKTGDNDKRGNIRASLVCLLSVFILTENRVENMFVYILENVFLEKKKFTNRPKIENKKGHFQHFLGRRNTRIANVVACL